MFHEAHSRSIFKSITWMVTAFLITIIVLYIITKNWKIAILDAILIQAIKFVFFYIHERIWNKSNFGQKLNVKKMIK